MVARCAWLLLFDGGSAPLQETRQYPGSAPISAQDAVIQRIGGAIAVHGLFDVPLMPWTPRAHIFAHCVSRFVKIIVCCCFVTIV